LGSGAQAPGPFFLRALCCGARVSGPGAGFATIARVGSPVVAALIAHAAFWLPFSSCVAILDVALVFVVVKGDVRLS